jgi:hypothetical protein
MKDKNALIGKKGWPSLKQKKGGAAAANAGGASGAGGAHQQMYVSPYSKNPNPK